ncbi:MAG: hypothetical protein QOD14_1821 [Solirubrobacterales bacterium]|jgi:hypothetical protein|nr:hypothetical protein [Solirubrobacterales bacterium]
MGNLKAVGLAIAFALAALGVSACGSGGSTQTTVQRPAVSTATADRLAKLSDRIATELDAGDTCHAAHSADDLRTAIQESDLPATLRPGVDAVAGRLVDQVNCPPPPAPQPEKKKPDKHKHDHPDQHHGGDHGPPGHGGELPPGQAKLKGEPG